MIAATPSPSPGPSDATSLTGLDPAQIKACGTAPAKLCLKIYDQTGSESIAGLSDAIVHAGHIVIIVVAAFVLRAIARRAIGRLARSIASGRDRVHRGLDALSRLDPRGLLEAEPATIERRSQRAGTITSVLRSITNAVIFALAIVLILGELGINLAPIIASAGIVGVAVGFGAQSVVKDFLSGIFLVLEDQYGVGDVIDLGPGTKVAGVVESIGLRSTRVRDISGTLWHIRNGDVSQVGNISQGWSRIVLDVVLALGADLDRARTALLAAAAAVAADERFTGDLLDEAAVWGVQDVAASGVTLRLAQKVRSPAKDAVTRALREGVLAELTRARVPVAGSS